MPISFKTPLLIWLFNSLERTTYLRFFLTRITFNSYTGIFSINKKPPYIPIGRNFHFCPKFFNYFSISSIIRTLSACLPPWNSAFKNASKRAVACLNVTNLAPKVITLASLCSRIKRETVTL